ncbi:hypothetical protein HAX54_030904, partial [Datura stramonium]|nr:hypothetical protein [Datura stramonium]
TDLQIAELEYDRSCTFYALSFYHFLKWKWPFYGPRNGPIAFSCTFYSSSLSFVDLFTFWHVSSYTEKLSKYHQNIV